MEQPQAAVPTGTASNIAMREKKSTRFIKLEPIPCNDLDLPHWTDRRDAAESRRIYRVYTTRVPWIKELRMVEEVERLGAENERLSLGDACALRNG